MTSLQMIHGQTIIATVYGDWERAYLANWRQLAVANELTLGHQPSINGTKNTSDMKLIMDAMEILHWRTDIQIFCIVSNDGHFTPLCQKLQNEQKWVVGMGKRNASDAFIRQCNQFIFVGKMFDDDMPSSFATPADDIINEPVTPEKDSVAPTKDIKTFKPLLLRAFAELAPYPAWVKLSPIGSTLRKIDPQFEYKHYGANQLSKLLEHLPEVIDLKQEGNTKSARLKESIAQKLRYDSVKVMIRQVFKESDTPKGWLTLSTLGQELRNIDPKFKPNQYGHATLSKLLGQMPDFIEIKKKSGTQSARLK